MPSDDSKIVNVSTPAPRSRTPVAMPPMPAPTMATRGVTRVPFHKSNDRVTIGEPTGGCQFVTDFATANFFRDRAVYDDPYEYFDWMRSQHPVWQEPNYGVFMVTGYDEAMSVYHDPTT